MGRTGPVEQALPHLALPPVGTGPAVLVIHSWWGLTDAFRSYADQLAAQGFVAACADLYGGQVATSEAEARSLRAARRRQPMYRTLLATIEALLHVTATVGSTVGVVGFSMGGHWAVWLSQRGEVPIGACVLYYAARAGDFSPSASPVLAHFADDDPYVSAQSRRRMERAIGQAARPYQSYDYPGTHHWFAETDQPTHDVDAASQAFERTVLFLRQAIA